MHIVTAHYDDFKRILTGAGVVPPPAPPAIDPATGKPVTEATAPKPAAEDPAKKVGRVTPKRKGTVYHWGGAVATGEWGAAFVAEEPPHDVISTRSVSSTTAPATFAADFPDAVQLESPLTISA